MFALIAIYQMSGNVLLPFFLFYIYPIVKVFSGNYDDDTTQIPQQAERAFAKSKMFLIPLYLHVFGHVMLWVYCLCLYSEKI